MMSGLLADTMGYSSNFIKGSLFSNVDNPTIQWPNKEYSPCHAALISILQVEVAKNLKKKSSKQNPPEDQIPWGREIPFGPYLAIATLLYLGGLNLWVDPWIKGVLAIIGKSY